MADYFELQRRIKSTSVWRHKLDETLVVTVRHHALRFNKETLKFGPEMDAVLEMSLLSTHIYTSIDLAVLDAEFTMISSPQEF